MMRNILFEERKKNLLEEGKQEIGKKLGINFKIILMKLTISIQKDDIVTT